MVLSISTFYILLKKGFLPIWGQNTSYMVNEDFEDHDDDGQDVDIYNATQE